jgi:hypothetical protein
MPKPNTSNAYSEKNFAVIDGITGAVTPTAPKINLSSLDDVRLEMAKVYREMRGKTLESGEGARLVYVLQQLAKLHETVEIARRLASLEMAVGGRAKP